jgi:histidine triad (HIT) family protein
MSKTIFSMIIDGEIPAHKVYEDSFVIAFLDIYPTQAGHTLVVPKKVVESVWELDEITYQHLQNVTKAIASHLKTVFSNTRITSKIEGFDVPHAHIHLIPCSTPEEFSKSVDRSVEPDHAALQLIAQKIGMIPSIKTAQKAEGTAA